MRNFDDFVTTIQTVDMRLIALSRKSRKQCEAMRVIENCRPDSKRWPKVTRCAECRSLLEVDKKDIYEWVTRSCDLSTERKNLFDCPVCSLGQEIDTWASSEKTYRKLFK